MTTQTRDVSVHDVVRYIREQLPDATAMQRHKLAYYVQAWHAAWEGRAMFPERIEAWTHGPVVRDVWIAETYDSPRPVRPLDERSRRIVDAVLAFYGRLTAAQLRALTHMEAPYITARHGLPEDAQCSEEIPVSEMRRFFTRRALLGEKMPVRPVDDTEPSTVETLRIADREIRRWREVLERLGQ